MNRRDFFKIAGLGLLGLLSPSLGTERLESSMKTFVELMIDVVDGKTLQPSERELLRQEFAQLYNLKSNALTNNSNASFRSVDTPIFNGENVSSPVKIYRSTNQSISNATATKVSFDTNVESPSGYIDIAANPTRITIPKGMGGKYLIGFGLLWNAMVLGGGGIPFCTAAIILNGDNAQILCDDSSYAAANIGPTLGALVPWTFSEGDYIELLVEQFTANSLNLLTRSNNRTPVMFMYKYL